MDKLSVFEGLATAVKGSEKYNKLISELPVDYRDALEQNDLKMMNHLLGKEVGKQADLSTINV